MASGVPPVLRQQVYDRDQGRCQRCARHCLTGPHSLHHRRPRQMGGDRHANTLANLVLLCGTANSPGGCHGHVERHRSEALAHKWLVPRGVDPATTPVLRFGRTWSLPGQIWTRADPPEESA